jgi:6-phosphofructokinase 1
LQKPAVEELVVSGDLPIVPVATLGEPGRPSPLRRTSTPGDGAAKFTPENRYVRHAVEFTGAIDREEDLLFEKAGARERIFFDPGQTRAGIVTCGGLCPGLNNVIRSVFLELHMNYGVQQVLGIRHGYQGLNPEMGGPPIPLTRDLVETIHEEGGTILGSSRGPQDPAVMVDFLQERGIDVLFCVGGDGTLRGAHALAAEIGRRGAKIGIVGIPKTIDNDIQYCDRSFGLLTAIDQAKWVLYCAHIEAKGAPNGIGLVKVMGRDAGFIAAGATLASQNVNFTLVPEIPFALDGEHGFLAALHRRMLGRRHAVIVVAEGAGQDLFQRETVDRDASGNIRYGDIGAFLSRQIRTYFVEHGLKVDVKYIDPSYIIRSVPANCEDAILCDQFGRRAAHAAMAGKTDVLIGHFSGTFTHVPIRMAIGQKRRMAVEGELWGNVLAATGQPKHFR